MARSIPPDRLAAVIDAAVGAFVAHGYRRTQMQDVADALGLAKGTLYGYAATKEALFAAAIRYGDGLEPLPDAGNLPLPAPATGALAALVAERLAAEVPDLALTKALARKRLPRTTGETEGELSGIVTDLYARLSRNRVAIKLVDRCAPELPELGRSLVRYRPRCPDVRHAGVPGQPPTGRSDRPARSRRDRRADDRRASACCGPSTAGLTPPHWRPRRRTTRQASRPLSPR